MNTKLRSLILGYGLAIISTGLALFSGFGMAAGWLGEQVSLPTGTQELSACLGFSSRDCRCFGLHDNVPLELRDELSQVLLRVRQSP